MKAIFINAADTSRHVSSANTAIYPNLGLLTLMTALDRSPVIKERNIALGYLDGTVCGNAHIADYIETHAKEIGFVSFSSLTANHGASIQLAKLIKRLNPAVYVIFGNDHFSALHENVMRNNPHIDFGFYGNDVVNGFRLLIEGIVSEKEIEYRDIPGIVFRDLHGNVKKVPEDAKEYGKLPLVNYALTDSIIPHNIEYIQGQQNTYHFMRGRNLKSQVVDIGRGCVKFSGPRVADIPVNACDFCGIIPGMRAISSISAQRAWKILKNVYDQGYNYFYVTADELPLTLWPMLRDMASTLPSWYSDIPVAARPKMFGYARAEAFDTQPEKLDVIVNVLGFDHFFVGFDGLSDISLRVMNKQSISKRGRDPLEQNMVALSSLVERGCLLTAGLVLTHLGITPSIMEENFRKLSEIVTAHPGTFAALDFGPLCPIPGSQSFRYLSHPETARSKAAEFGLRIDLEYLERHKGRFEGPDVFEMDDLISHFLLGCCPDVSQSLVDDYLGRTTELAVKHGIVVGGGV